MQPTGRGPLPKPRRAPDRDQASEVVGLWVGLRSRWALVSLATFLFWFAAHSLRPYITLRLDALGASGVEIGWIVAAYPLLSLFVALPGGRAIDRLGLRRVLFGSLAGTALTGAAYAVATTPLQILGVQVVNGIVEVGAWLALQALASHAGSGAFLTRQLSLFSLGWGAGIAVGPVVGAAVYGRFGFAPLGLLYLATTALALACVALVPYRDPAKDPDRAPGGAVRDLRDLAGRPAVRAVLLSSFVALYVISIKNSFYTLYLEQSGVPLSRIGLLLSVAGLASLAIRVPLPHLLHRWGTTRVLVIGMWMAVAGVTSTPWLTSFPALMVGAAFMGAGYGSNPPVTVELLARTSGPGERGMAMALRVSANRSAQVVQPLVFGAMVALTGMAAAFSLSGALLAGLTGWASRQVTRGDVGGASPDVEQDGPEPVGGDGASEPSR